MFGLSRPASTLKMRLGRILCALLACALAAHAAIPVIFDTDSACMVCFCDGGMLTRDCLCSWLRLR